MVHFEDRGTLPFVRFPVSKEAPRNDVTRIELSADASKQMVDHLHLMQTTVFDSKTIPQLTK